MADASEARGAVPKLCVDVGGWMSGRREEGQARLPQLTLTISQNHPVLT